MITSAILKQASKQAERCYNYIVRSFVMLNFIPSKLALLCPQETVRRRASFCFGHPLLWKPVRRRQGYLVNEVELFER